MNRRTFLGSLALLTAGMALDPERALWVPGRKTILDLHTATRLPDGFATEHEVVIRDMARRLAVDLDSQILQRPEWTSRAALFVQLRPQGPVVFGGRFADNFASE